MWFMNHVYNPIVRWILQSSLHKMMSKDVLLIAFRGRKSGKEYITPVQYTREGGSVWILVGFPEKKNWWHNLTGGAGVKLCIEGKWLEGKAIMLRGETDRKAMLTGLQAIYKKFPVLQKANTSVDDSGFDTTGFVLVLVTLNEA